MFRFAKPKGASMSPFTLFRSAVCAGFAIGLGGAVYLQQTSKALGALLFTIGLFAVCECRFHLLQARSAMPGNGLGAAIGSTQSS